MSAPNFCIVNAKRYFTYETQDDYDYDYYYLRKMIEQTARDNGWETIGNNDYLRRVEGSGRYDHSYPASAIPVYRERSFKDRRNNLWTITIVPLLRSGCYSGATLDFYIELEDPYDRLENQDVLNQQTIREEILAWKEYIDEYLDEPPIESAEACELEKHIVDTLTEIIADFNQLGEQTCSNELLLGGIFSNGEAVYVNKTKLNQSKTA